MKFLLLCTVLVLHVSCKKKVLEISTEAYIIGNNDIKPLGAKEQNEIPEIAWRSSVLLATVQRNGKLKFCSGTVILPSKGQENPRVLSNHHCFAVADEQGLPLEELIPEACVNTRIWSGFSAANDFNTSYASCVPGTLKTNHSGDTAEFEIDSLPKGAQANTFDLRAVPAKTQALIVHYPAVKEQYTTIAGTNVKLPAASLTIEDCIVIGRFPREDWKLDKSLEFGLRHSCDLIHGSSGSALLDRTSGKIIGVNWGGIKLASSDGEDVYNVATVASYAAAFVGLSETSFDQEKTRLRESGHSDGRNQNKKEKGGFEKKLTDAIPGCGVIGITQKNGWLLLTPFLVLLVRFRRFR